MIRGMVERLAERLKQRRLGPGGLAAAGARLYGIGRPRPGAVRASTDARRALGQDADKLRRLDELVKELRLEG